jgi:hypothetical protein
LTRRDASGFTTIQYVVATALSMVLFVLVANLLVDLYERAVVRDALDEGVHAAVPAAATAASCEQRARDVLQSLGAVSYVAALRCEQHDDAIVAIADVSLRSWLPGLTPTWRVGLRASARRER